jgi:hypothetical protein
VENPWLLIWSIGLICLGIYWIVKRNAPVGIAGYPPSFYPRGKAAVLLGIVAIVVGLILAMDLPGQLRIDKCLDRGGRYDYQNDVCIDKEVE